MKLLLLFLSLILPTSAYGGIVAVGISEKQLLQSKGPPESKAALGKMSIYRWRDMEITVIDERVSSVRLRDQKVESKNAAASVAAAAKKKEDAAKVAATNLKNNPPTDGPAADYYVEIVEVLRDGGVVVDLLKYQYSEGVTSHMQSIGGGGGGSGPVASLVTSGKLAYLLKFPGCVTGDRYKINAAPAGSYKYERDVLRRFIVFQSTQL